MLDFMRKQAGSWLIKGLLAIIVIVFVFWGVGSFRSRQANRVALINGEVITEKELESKLAKISSENGNKTVIIRADKRLNYGSVIKVMGICKGAKLKDIGVTVK